MQYTLLINQVKAVEWELNSPQAALMAFIYDLESWGDDVVNDNFAYKWISKQKVIDELPLYFSKPDTVHRNLIDLEKKGLIVRNATSKRSLVKLTGKGKEWRITSEINPTKVGNKSDLTSDLNPTDPSTNIIEPDINKNTKANKSLDFTSLKFSTEEVEEFKTLRNKAKAPITQRVIDNHAKEFDKSRQNGMNNDHILNIWSDKGWKAYKYEWAKNAIRVTSPQQGYAYAQRQQTEIHKGIEYGEFADQSIFPEELQLATNEIPAVKESVIAMRRTYIEQHYDEILAKNGGIIREDVGDNEWQGSE